MLFVFLYFYVTPRRRTKIQRRMHYGPPSHNSQSNQIGDVNFDAIPDEFYAEMLDTQMFGNSD